MGGFDVIKIERNDELGLATVRLNRPDKRNALSGEMVNVLDAELNALRNDPKVRAVFFRGNGAAFCAGADLAEIQKLQAASVQQNRDDSHRLRDFFVKLYTFPKPTAAIVHGPALAGGCGLATCCDFIVADANATFGYPEVRIGFIPAIVMVLLTHQIGERAARDLCLTGRTITAEEGLRLGLVQRLVEPEVLDDAALALARELRKNSPQAMATVKHAFWRLHGMSTEDALVAASDLNAISRATDDCREGIAAFLDKRRPGWAE